MTRALFIALVQCEAWRGGASEPTGCVELLWPTGFAHVPFLSFWHGKNARKTIH